MQSYTIYSGALSAFAALVGAAIGAALTHFFNRTRESLDLKRDVLRRLMGYRWHLAEGQEQSSSPVYTALNEIVVVFAGDKRVEKAVSEFYQAIQSGFRTEHLSPLLLALAISADVSHRRWHDDLLEQPFSPPQMSED